MYYAIPLQNRMKVKTHVKNCLAFRWYLKKDFLAAVWVLKI